MLIQLRHGNLRARRWWASADCHRLVDVDQAAAHRDADYRLRIDLAIDHESSGVSGPYPGM